MATFAIYSGPNLVGTSELECGDPPMGVAFGRFYPGEHYAAIRGDCIKSADQANLELAVKTPGGAAIECEGVGIVDKADTGMGEVEVHVLGISDPPYNSLFPHHVARYEQQFKGSSGE